MVTFLKRRKSHHRENKSCCHLRETAYLFDLPSSIQSIEPSAEQLSLHKIRQTNNQSTINQQSHDVHCGHAVQVKKAGCLLLICLNCQDSWRSENQLRGRTVLTLIMHCRSRGRGWPFTRTNCQDPRTVRSTPRSPSRLSAMIQGLPQRPSMLCHCRSSRQIACW